MARKPRVVPFQPNPRDGDLDGLVQDGTIWERPKGAYLRFIDTGEIWSELGQVDRDSVEFVRPDGSVWEFTPSWVQDDSTVGGTLGTLGDRLPLVFQSNGMLPRGFLGPTLADESRFDDAVDDVEVLALMRADDSVDLNDQMNEKLDRLLLPEAVESGLITQETQDKLKAFRNRRWIGRRASDEMLGSSREISFDYLEDTLLSEPLERQGLSKGELYESIPLGYFLRDLVRYGDKDTIAYLSAELDRLQKESTLRRRTVEELLGPIDEDSVQGFLAMVKTMPVSTWHEHHIREVVEAYARRDFYKLNYHLKWLDAHSVSGKADYQFGWLSQLQYMADNPELLDTLFRAGADLKDYDYLTGYAFQSKLAKIRKNLSRRKSDRAARSADKITNLDSSTGIDPTNRLVDRAGVYSGQYQDLDLVTVVLKDIELAELEIGNAQANNNAPLEEVLRERLAELKTELRQVTKPIDIEITFTDEVLEGLGDGGVLSYIPGGADNPDLRRKIVKSVDSISPEFRPRAIVIDYWKGGDGKAQKNSTSAGWYYGATGVLVINPRTLDLHEHMVVDEKRGTVKRFGPDDGPDGIEVPLGMTNSPVELQRLFDIDSQHGMSNSAAPSLDTVAVHESVHSLDYLLASDEFFRLQMRLEYELELAENIVQRLGRSDAESLTPSEAENLKQARESIATLKAQLAKMNATEFMEDWMMSPDSAARRLAQSWVTDNKAWLEEYARGYGSSVAGADQHYLLSIFGYSRTDYILQKHGVSISERDGLTPQHPKYDDIRRTESMEVLAEVLSSHITGLRRIPAGRNESLPEELSRGVEQIIPEELKFILSERGWSEEEIPSLTAMRGRSELRLSESRSEERLRLLGQDVRLSLVPGRRPNDDFIDRLFGRGDRSSTLASDPSATSAMLSAAERDDRNNRILEELAQAEVDEPKLFKDGKLVDKVWAPFSPAPHLAGPGLREELEQARAWREVSQILKGKRVVVFDTETAGRMDPDEVDQDRIVQLGGVVYVDGMVVDRFSMYVNVDYDELSDWSQANLIDAEGKPMSPEFLAKQPDMPTVLQEFMRFANGDSDGSDVVFMAHNAAFDLKRMELERQRHDPDGVPSFDLDEVTYFDTMGLGNIVKKSGVEGAPTSAGLKNLQEFFGLEDFSWHTADADSEMTGQVLWRLLDYMDENDVSLDGLDSVAGVKRYREALEKYEGEIPEFLRQKERLAELKGMIAELRSDPRDTIMEMRDSDEVWSLGERYPDYDPPEVTKLTIANHLGFATASDLDEAVAFDPIIAENVRILQELADNGVDFHGNHRLRGEDLEDRLNQIGVPKQGRSTVTDEVIEKDIVKGIEKLKLAIDDPNTLDERVVLAKALLERLESMSLEDQKAAVVEYVRREILEDPDTTLVVGTRHFRSIADSGRLTNGFDPAIPSEATAGGLGLGGSRDEAEASLLGIPKGTRNWQIRPSYGIVVTGKQRRYVRELMYADRDFIPVREQDGIVRPGARMSDEALGVLKGEIMPQMWDELFPGKEVLKLHDLPEEDKLAAITFLNEKIRERFPDASYLNDEGKALFAMREGVMFNSVYSEQIMIDPKVMGRTTVTNGDSFNNNANSIPITGDLSDEDILYMVFSGGEREKLGVLEMAVMERELALGSGLNPAVRAKDQDGFFSQQYLEAQIYGGVDMSEVLVVGTNSRQEISQFIADRGFANIPSLTPQSEVDAARTVRAAERADRSIEAVAADAAATIDDLDDAGDEVASLTVAEITQLDNLSSPDELTGVDDLTASVERIQEHFPSLQDLRTRLDSGARIFYDSDTDLYFALDDSGGGPTEIQTFESFDEFVYSIDTSELEEQALQDWREGDAKRTVVFHGTTAEALETIRTEGLNPRSDTRGIVNRGVGDAVYTSETADVAEAGYDVVVEIDLPRAIEDGIISVDSLDREPDVIRNEVLEGIASSFGVDDFVPEESIDGTRPDTVVISDRIPPEYLLVNGEPLVPQSVSKGTLPDSVGRESLGGSSPRNLLSRNVDEIKNEVVYQIAALDSEEAERVSAMSLEEFEAELVDRVAKYLVDTMKDASLSMRIDGPNFRKLVDDDGKFKNQFETGYSKGYFNPVYRKIYEARLLGVGDDVEDALRPKYGYVEGSVWDEGITNIEGYGDINIRLKNEVVDRTTVSFGDTLDDDVAAIRINDLRDGSVDPTRLSNSIAPSLLGNVWLESDSNVNVDGRELYAELQFHGNLGLEHVDEVVLSRRTIEFDTREEAEVFLKVLQDAGITLKVLKSEEEIVITVENLDEFLLKLPS